MDDADRAQLVEPYVEASRFRRVPRRPPTAGAMRCAGCGAEIPAERRRALAGTDRCVECQEELEGA